MARKTEPDPEPDAPGLDDDSSTEDRLNAVEAGLARIETAISKLGAPALPAPARDDDSGGQTTVEEQVRAALAQADAERAAKDKDDALHGDLGQVKADLAALKEKPPEQPQRKIERIMYGPRG